MVHIFYIFILFAIIWEMLTITQPTKVSDFMNKYIHMDSEKATAKQSKLANYMLGYAIWCLVGLVTNEWVLFLILIILGFVPKSNPKITFINGLLSFIVLILIILNAYHFHADIISMIF